MTAELAVVGNPSSLHTSGRRARRVVEESRESIAQALGARPSEVLFTSGGTESDNLAVKGLFHARREADPRRVRAAGQRRRAPRRPGLRRLPGRRTRAPRSPGWRSTPQGRRAARDGARRDRGRPRLGRAGQRDVGQQRGRHGAAGGRASSPSRASTASRCTPTPCRPSVQVPVDFAACGADLLTVTGHKVGGPPGVGVLLARRDVAPGAAQPRRRPGAPAAQRHPRHPRDPRPRGGGRASASAAARPRRPGWWRCATG